MSESDTTTLIPASPSESTDMDPDDAVNRIETRLSEGDVIEAGDARYTYLTVEESIIGPEIRVEEDDPIQILKYLSEAKGIAKIEDDTDTEKYHRALRIHPDGSTEIVEHLNGAVAITEYSDAGRVIVPVEYEDRDVVRDQDDKHDPTWRAPKKQWEIRPSGVADVVAALTDRDQYVTVRKDIAEDAGLLRDNR